MGYELDRPELAWWLPQIEDRGPTILINGTIRPPAWPPAEPIRLAIDGVPAVGTDYLELADKGAITVRGMLPVASSFGDKDEVVLRVVGASSGAYLRDWDHFHLARPGRKSAVALPPDKLTQRAIWLPPRVFEKWGHAQKRKYDAAVARHQPKPRDEWRFLDWGCGAGRMARYMAFECDYTGIDIDREAIDWCRANIPKGRFELQGLEPRTIFAAKTFDAVIGISIFTHLKEDAQFAWLQELARVTKPDGVVAVSTCGATSLFNAGDPPEVRAALEARGFCDTGPEFTLKGVTADDEYYRNCYHTHAYIREQWSRWFEVLEILPGFVANMQDMVFLRPRA
ncbi:MAG TPA: methyltransferase domain-containing protein [Rhizomicrobium sp.]|nr:methyltransferase domain-containing protein [Rhizomicrobium sp.]